MIQSMTKPTTREEIRTALDIRCAEMGISRSTYAVRELGVAPHILNFLLAGRTRTQAQPDVIAKVNSFIAADMAAWER